MSDKHDSFATGLFSKLIFGSRWLQLPLYLGLIIAQCAYVYLFCMSYGC